MTTRNRGLQISIVAGLIAIVLVLAALVLHVVDSDTAMAGLDTDHSTAQTTITTQVPTTRETMLMPDGSVMYMDDMPATVQEESTPATAGHDSMEGMDMGGSIDGQVILLILALIAAAIAFGTAINAYLRRQLESGALAQPEPGCE